MNQQRSSTATDAAKAAKAARALVFLGALSGTALAFAAQVAGTVANLSGPLIARKADGTVKVLSVKSTVEEGDTLIAEKDTYARIRFTDNSEITLKPGTQLKIDSFNFEEDKPEKDSAAFNLVKGGLRAVTGALGKRSRERFGMNTPTATIGIRGTIFIAEYVPPQSGQPVQTGQSDRSKHAAYAFASVAAVGRPYANGLTVSDAPWSASPLEMLPPRGELLQLAQAGAPQPSPGLNPGRAPGLYVQVLDGMINLSNQGGSQDFLSGQFGYSASVTVPPVILPNNPGMQFTPPPVFNSSIAPQGSGNAASGNGNDVDCEVR
ncbi:FecR family protein [Noviherbaspirillum malthae]|uniref:FecR family protein n=1 Tax=Noviherbaspirillum malthae TaxID=1260987 RepID=UPI001E3343C0|nr:FecR family protein [Noviherbaspirillum malthae]